MSNPFLCRSPEGSYTDIPNQEHRAPPQPDQHEFDDEFEDDDPLPAIGHCKALYSFDGAQPDMSSPHSACVTAIFIFHVSLFRCVCVYVSVRLRVLVCPQALMRARW